MICSQILRYHDFMGRAPHPVNKQWKKEIKTKSQNIGNQEFTPPCAQVKLITAGKNHVLYNMLLQVSKSDIMTDSQILGNQKLMGRAPHRAHN